MTVPAALPSPGAAPVAGPALPVGEPTDDTTPSDAFAMLLAALGGGVVVPVPGVPVQPGPAGTTEPEPLATAALSSVALSPASPGPAPAAPGTDVTPVVWQATTQRAVVAAEVAVAPAPTAPAALVPDAPVAAPAAAPGAAEQPAAPAVAAELPEPPVAPEALDPAATPVVTAPAAATVSSPAAAPAAAPASEQVSSSHRVQPALVEAARGLRDEGGGRTSLVVRLDPPELGAVVVRLTVQDGRVDVQLRTPDATARGDLQAQAFDVQRVLRDNGFDLTSFDVAQGGTRGDVPGGAQEDARTPDRGTPQQQAPADGRPGTSHVTDDADDPQTAGTWL